MDEQEKKVAQEGAGGKNHGRRRRHRHGKGHGGNGGNGVNAQAQNMQGQNPQAQNTQKGQNAQAQNQGKQPAQQNHKQGEQKQGNGQGKQGKPQQNNPQNNAQNNAQKNGKQQKPQQQNNGQKQAQPQPSGGQKQPQPQQKQQAQNAQAQQNNAQGKNKQKNKQEKKAEQQQQQQRKDTYVYVLDGNLYLNLTNKCSNGCDFCVRNERSSYYGNYLWLQKGEPTAQQVIAQINGMGDLKRFKEAVFCGFGEPTYRMEVMCEVADYLHEKGLSTRLNTNGQGCLINKRDIVPELIGKIDLVNVSLNASCYEKYQKICRSMFREAGFDGMVEFAKSCKRQGVNVRFSIVDCIGEEEVEACKRLAAKVNVPLYIRDYITDS